MLSGRSTTTSYLHVSEINYLELLLESYQVPGSIYSYISFDTTEVKTNLRVFIKKLSLFSSFLSYASYSIKILKNISCENDLRMGILYFIQIQGVCSSHLLRACATYSWWKESGSAGDGNRTTVCAPLGANACRVSCETTQRLTHKNMKHRRRWSMAWSVRCTCTTCLLYTSDAADE